PDERSSENISLFRVLGGGGGGHLIRLRCQQFSKQILKVVAVRRKIGCQPIEQVRVPRPGVHIVKGFDQSSTEQLLPVAIDDGARHAPISRIGKETSSSGVTFGEGGVLRYSSELGVEQMRSYEGTLFDITANQLEFRLGREERGHAIRFTQLVPVDKAVVAGSAFQINAEEYLPRVLRGLHIRCLAGIHRSAPIHA